MIKVRGEREKAHEKQREGGAAKEASCVKKQQKQKERSGGEKEKVKGIKEKDKKDIVMDHPMKE